MRRLKQVWWKTLLSYLTEVKLETVSSSYSDQLEVVYRKGRYALQTANAVYSFDDLYINFRHSFLKIPLKKLAIKKVLVLGLGLGSIPYMLEHVFGQQYHYTAVEIDPQVVRLAQKYNLDYLDSPTEVICLDAAVFVRDCQEQYDLITLDIFIDDTVPTAFEQLDFLEQLRKLLSANAILLYNRLTSTPALKEKNRQFFEQKFKKVFPDAQLFDLSGNKMLVNRHI